MTPQQGDLVKYFGGLPEAESVLNPSEDFHWSKIFAWNRGGCFRLSTPIHAANFGTKWIQNFSRIYGPAVMMPLSLLGKGLGFGVRAIKEKKFSTNFFQNPGFYSATTCFNETFSYGTPIMVVEGVLDAEVASLFYPWVLATLTSKISEPQAFLLSCLTNTLILSFDNDESGEAGAHFSGKYLQKWGLNYFKLQPPASVKDWGDLLSWPRENVQGEVNRMIVTLRSKGVL